MKKHPVYTANTYRLALRRLATATAILLGLVVVVSVSAGGRQELDAVREMEIAAIDISTIPDGTYDGSYTYLDSVQRVRVTVEAGVITAIEVLEGSETKHGLQGRAVLDRVIGEQRTDVDAISGATTTSKAYLKAVERALLSAGAT